jgi:hypothetical protein
MTSAIRDAPLGLDIDMEQLAWPLALVAHHLAGWIDHAVAVAAHLLRERRDSQAADGEEGR